MLESLITAFGGLITATKAMASFDVFFKGRKGDARALIEELKRTSRLCFHVATRRGVVVGQRVPDGTRRSPYPLPASARSRPPLSIAGKSPLVAFVADPSGRWRRAACLVLTAKPRNSS